MTARRRKRRVAVSSAVVAATQIVPTVADRQDVDMADEYLDTKQVAKLLKMNGDTLAVWRSRGKGPAFVEVGERRILYRRVDVASWLDSQRVVPGARH